MTLVASALLREGAAGGRSASTGAPAHSHAAPTSATAEVSAHLVSVTLRRPAPERTLQLLVLLLQMEGQ